MRKARANMKPPSATRASRRETPETWWIETKPTRFGFEAVARSDHDRILGKTIDGWGGFAIWRPSERWAYRANLRVLRAYLAREKRDAEAEDRTRVYPVRG